MASSTERAGQRADRRKLITELLELYDDYALEDVFDDAEFRAEAGELIATHEKAIRKSVISKLAEEAEGEARHTFCDGLCAQSVAAWLRAKAEEDR